MTPIYGVWIRGAGWLRGPLGIVSFALKEIAEDTARRVSGEARYIDDALRDLEQNILSIEAQQEAQKWNVKIKKYFRSK